MKKRDTDGGFRSRKLLFALFSLLLIFVGALLSTESKEIATVYPVMVGGIEMITAIYLGGNVGAKWVITRNSPQTKEEPEEKKD